MGGRVPWESTSFSLNPKIGLGFMNPIWVEKGSKGFHLKNASIRGRPSIKAKKEQAEKKVGKVGTLKGGKMVVPNRVKLGLGKPNPKFGLGFMNPIWVQNGSKGFHLENVSSRGRPSIGASG